MNETQVEKDQLSQNSVTSSRCLEIPLQAAKAKRQPAVRDRQQTRGNSPSEEGSSVLRKPRCVWQKPSSAVLPSGVSVNIIKEFTRSATK